MPSKKCVSCGEIKIESEFNFKNKKTGRRNGRCKECTRRDIRQAYQKNRAYYLAYRAEYNQKAKHEKRKFIFDYLSKHPCVDCGLNDPIVLQFDHVKGTKVGNVSQLAFARGFSLKKVREEISKCEIRCANCHAKKTAKDRGFYAGILGMKKIIDN